LVVKRFLIRGWERIHDVGARPRIYELANKNGVKVFARNIHGRNEIEVIADGKAEDVKAFHECVKTANIIAMGKGKRKNPQNTFEVGELETYKGKVDFTYFAGASTMEQVSKGTQYLKSIDKRMEELPKKIAEAIKESK